jgi:hypothetical protein
VHRRRCRIKQIRRRCASKPAGAGFGFGRSPSKKLVHRPLAVASAIAEGDWSHLDGGAIERHSGSLPFSSTHDSP